MMKPNRLAVLLLVLIAAYSLTLRFLCFEMIKQ